MLFYRTCCQSQQSPTHNQWDLALTQKIKEACIFLLWKMPTFMSNNPTPHILRLLYSIAFCKTPNFVPTISELVNTHLFMGFWWAHWASECHCIKMLGKQQVNIFRLPLCYVLCKNKKQILNFNLANLWTPQLSRVLTSQLDSRAMSDQKAAYNKKLIFFHYLQGLFYAKLPHP